jgi:nucleotide-binding universal stress UspA family protein
MCNEKNVFCQTHLLSRGMSHEEDLILFAKENRVDEIVIGIKKKSKVGKLILGSTASFEGELKKKTLLLVIN